MQLDTKEKLSRTSILLHWIVAITIICLLASGIYMEEQKVYALYPWHKSFGFIIMFFVLFRIYWRLKNGWPVPVSNYTDFEKKASKFAHWVLIIGTAIMPMSGFILSVVGGHGLDVFGFELFAKNYDPIDPKKTVAINQSLASLGHTIHHWLGYLMVATVFLHVIGAFKHHIVDKDNTLKRMLGRDDK